uniref:Uncharacterized protein n=1 Tax=Magallana gigas TaxID=29159 RepID=K1QCT2_MAGGI
MERAMEILETGIGITGENVDLPLSMERLVECLLRRSNAFQVLCDKNVNELNIFGYYYEPCDYLDATVGLLHYKLMLFTWEELAQPFIIGDFIWNSG